MRAAGGLLAAIFVLVGAGPASAATRYVDAIAGNDANACTSPGNGACLTIAGAIAKPGAGDEIVVAAGTYSLFDMLTVGEEVDLKGDPAGGTLLQRAGGGGRIMDVTSGAARSRFSHLTFRSTPNAVTGNPALVTVAATSTFEHVAFELVPLASTSVPARALMVDAPGATVTMRDVEVDADASFAAQDGGGLLETEHGVLAIEDLVATNVAKDASALAAVAAGSVTGSNDAVLEVRGATISTGGRCLALFGGASARGSVLSDISITQDVPGTDKVLQECVRVGSRHSTIDGLTINAPDTTASGDRAAILAWDADNLTLRDLRVTSSSAALRAAAKSCCGAGTVTNLQVEGGELLSSGPEAVVLRNGTGRLRDLLVGGAAAGVYFQPSGNTGTNQFQLRNITASGGSTGIFAESTAGNTVTVTGKNLIAVGTSFADIIVNEGTNFGISYSYYDPSNNAFDPDDDGNNQTGNPGFTGPGSLELAGNAPARDAGLSDAFTGPADWERDPRNGTIDIGGDEVRAAVVPQTTITNGPPSGTTDRTPRFWFEADDGNASFVCDIEGGSTPVDAGPCSFGSYVAGTPLADGAYTFSVAGTNGSGADPTPATRVFTVDTVAPDTTASAPALTNDATTPITLGAPGEPGVTFRCAIDGQPESDCAVPFSTPSLPDGPHTLVVRARDAAGNPDPTPASVTWTVDTVAPDTTIAAGAPTAATTGAPLSIAFSAEPGATFTCKLGPAAAATCASPFQGTAPATAGRVTFTVAAVDLAGNQDETPAELAIDVSAPPVGPPAGPDPGQGGIPGPGVGPTADTTKPVVSLKVPRTVLKEFFKNGVVPTATSNERTTGTIKIEIGAAGQRTVSSTRRITVTPGKPLKLRLKPSKAVVRKLRRAKKLKVGVTLTLRDAAGNTATVKRTLTLRR